MLKTLQKHGNSHALVFDKTMLEMLNIGPDTPLHLRIAGNSLVVTPADVGLGEESVRELVRELRPRYGKLLKDLADK